MHVELVIYILLGIYMHTYIRLLIIILILPLCSILSWWCSLNWRDSWLSCSGRSCCRCVLCSLVIVACVWRLLSCCVSISFHLTVRELNTSMSYSILVSTLYWRNMILLLQFLLFMLDRMGLVLASFERLLEHLLLRKTKISCHWQRCKHHHLLLLLLLWIISFAWRCIM